MRLPILFFLLAFLAPPAGAQDREGNDRPSNWAVTHFAKSGIWESMCDERPEDGIMHRRCYIRQVDVFSPRPKFAAQFMFITPEDDGLRVEFGMEPGTIFQPSGFRIEAGGNVSWSTRRIGCLTGLTCVFRGEEATDLVGTMVEGGDFLFGFVDRHGTRRDLVWPLEGFAEALADFRTQAAVRGLL